jgi:hypothetical protein
MFFIAILFITTLSIAGTAAFFSVYGLAQLFQGMMIPVMIMGASLEAGKLVTASFLYRYWNKLKIGFRVYLVTAVIVLMAVTSMGIFGMLSLGYQADTLPLKQVNSQIKLLNEEQIQLATRKQEIDKQIEALPVDYVKGRQKLMKTFAPELTRINNRLPEITTETQKLNTQLLTTQAHVGPIIYIAEAFGQDVDDATKYVILLIIVVFDPLAVALTIGVNVAIRIRKEEKLEEKIEDQIIETITESSPTYNGLTSDEIRLLVEDEIKKSHQEQPTNHHLDSLAKKQQIVSDLRSFS